MEATMVTGLTIPDTVVLENLFGDIKAWRDKQRQQKDSDANKESQPLQGHNDEADIKLLTSYNNKNDPNFTPTVFTTWDEKDISPFLNKYLVQPYSRIGQTIVRHPTDVVFLTHLIIIFVTVIPSAIYLYIKFNYFHAVLHTCWAGFCMGPFTLLMHNHIHNNGILSKRFWWLDAAFPYVLEPLMGHSWDSYYYHHVKHHHVEGNNPDDLSSTVRYQRDEPFDFLCYVARFCFFIWLELPLYFVRKGKFGRALKAAISEYGSYAMFYFMATKVNFRATLFVMLIPFSLLRFAMMVGNFGQHALVDEIEPDSDFRSSITLIDVPSNRFCFNDGYHTAHHLNPRRHWREQPVHFLKSKAAYREGRALVFHDIDYNMLTFRVLRKDYMYLAKRLVPIGSQIDMSLEEIAAMLKTKTKKFSEEDIRKKFPKTEDTFDFAMLGQAQWVLQRAVSVLTGLLPNSIARIEKTK